MGKELLWRKVIYVFPAKSRAALDAIDVAHGMIACGHGPVVGLAFDDIDTGRARYQSWKHLEGLRHDSHSVKEVSASMLTIKCL